MPAPATPSQTPAPAPGAVTPTPATEATPAPAPAPAAAPDPAPAPEPAPAPAQPTERERTLKRELSAARARLGKAEAATQTPEEKLEASNQRIRELTVQVKAGALNIVDPAAAVALINWSNVDINDDAAVDAALTDLIKTKTYLVKPAEAPAVPDGEQTPAPKVSTPSGNPARSSTTPTMYTRAQVADRAFYEANRADIMKAMGEGRITD